MGGVFVSSVSIVYFAGCLTFGMVIVISAVRRPLLELLRQICHEMACSCDAAGMLLSVVFFSSVVLLELFYY
jgi:hypothetical protein